MENKQDYYQVGSREDIVISNSSLNSFITERGGSPKRFLEFLDNKDEVKTKYFITGSLLHQWAEDKNSFHIASVAKPSEKLGIVADAAIEVIKNHLKSAYERIESLENIADIESRKIQIENYFVSILLEDSEELKEIILNACRAIGWNNNYKDDAIKKNACPIVMPYVQDSLKAEGENKVYLTLADSILLEGMITSIKDKDSVYESLFDSSDEFEEGVKVFTEFEHYWNFYLSYYNEETNNDQKTLINAKLKADKVVIDFKQKIVKIKDLKTTTGSPYAFIKSLVKFDYLRQFAFYYLGMVNYLKEVEKVEKMENWKFEFENIVVEKGGSFECARVVLDSDAVQSYVTDLKIIIKELAWHIGNNIWKQTQEEYFSGGFITLTKEQIEKAKNNN